MTSSESTNWPILSIAECAADEPYSTQIGPFGKALTPEEYTSTGVPLLRGVNVNKGRFHDHDFVFIAEETAERLRKFESYPGDVLLVHKGTLGKIGLMPTDRRFHRYIMGNSMLRVRCNPMKLLPEYLYYWFCSTEGQNYIFSRVSQVGVPQIQTPLKTLREARLRVPPISVQSRITNILGKLDEKIELNRRMNETLEAMARRLFRSWFIDFDPVHAKAAARREYPGLDNAELSRRALPNMAPEIAELFPDTFQDSPLGPIPKSWKVDEIGNVVTVLGGGTPSTNNPAFWVGGVHAFCTPKDMSGLNSSVLLRTERCLTESGVAKVSSGLLPPGTVLLSSRAPIGYLAIAHVPVAINQGIIAMVCDKVLPNQFVIHWARTNQDAIIANANGSTFLEISKRNFRPLPVTIPNPSILGDFQHRAKLLYDTIAKNQTEILELVKIRDGLIPRLLSGELDTEYRLSNHGDCK